MAGIRYGLEVYRDATADLASLMASDRKAALRIAVVLQEIGDDQNLLDLLNVEGHEDERFGVKAVVELQRSRWNAYRLTIKDLELGTILPYRVLYAFDGKCRIYHVLAVKPRGIAYNAATIDRAIAACRSLGIEPLPR